MYEVGTQVRYHGSIEWLHGEIFTVAASYADRYRLTGPHTLTNVRHTSVTAIDGESEPGHRADLERAIADQRPVMITYVAGDGEWTTRTIEPYELAETGAGREIVRAMDHLRGEPRTFRLDRIHATDLLPGGFRLDRPALNPDRAECDAFARIRAEIAQVAEFDYRDEARWTPDFAL